MRVSVLESVCFRIVGRCRSVEALEGCATWSESVVEVVLHKGDGGLGFSILDYQASNLLL